MDSNALKRKKLHFIVEENIPYMRGTLEPYGTVEYLASDAIDHDAAMRADALLVRTRTRCDATLLSGTPVRLVATATIGTDHIDIPWCRANGIRVANAPGCNAPAVAQYVLTALANLANRPIHQYRMGIVGVGHVGEIVRLWAASLGIDLMLCDPPRQRAEGGDQWHTLRELADSCDVITFHTPLTKEGPDATFHMADREFFHACRRAPIIINAARGPVVDTEAIIEAIKEGLIYQAVIDTWEGEPNISRQLLELTSIATPHIAGYSRQGKMRATRAVLDALSETFALPPIPFTGERTTPVLQRVNIPQLLWSYDPYADDSALRRSPDTFEALRNNYALRSEPQRLRR